MIEFPWGRPDYGPVRRGNQWVSERAEYTLDWFGRAGVLLAVLAVVFVLCVWVPLHPPR